MVCKNCGTSLSDKAAVCFMCGTKVESNIYKAKNENQNNNQFVQSPISMVKNEDYSSDDLLSLFIGPNADKIINNKYNVPSALLGLFFGPVWFFYRKMYTLGFIFFAILVILNILLSLFAYPLGTIVIACLLLFNTNFLYIKFAKTKINNIKRNNNQDIKELIKNNGGVSNLNGIIYIVIYICLIIGIILGINNYNKKIYIDLELTKPWNWKDAVDGTYLYKNECRLYVYVLNDVENENQITTSIDKMYVNYGKIVNTNAIYKHKYKWSINEYQVENFKSKILYNYYNNKLYVVELNATTVDDFNYCNNDFNKIINSLYLK